MAGPVIAMAGPFIATPQLAARIDINDDGYDEPPAQYFTYYVLLDTTNTSAAAEVSIIDASGSLTLIDDDPGQAPEP